MWYNNSVNFFAEAGMRPRIVEYKINTCVDLDVLLLSDLHSHSADGAIEAAKQAEPDVIVLAGDITETLGDPYHGNDKTVDNSEGFRLMRECAAVAPTYYALGNHEMRPYPENLQKINETGVVFLDNSFVMIKSRNGKDVAIGGLASGLKEEGILKPTFAPDLEWLDDFCRLECYKILINHHPEYWAPYIKDRGVGLTLSGHAHGGQIRLLGRGVLAPGQGFFPKYAGGIFKDKNSDALVVGRGLANTGKPIPRLFNPIEAPLVRLVNKKN